MAAAITAIINPVDNKLTVFYLNESRQVDLHDIGGLVVESRVPEGYIKKPSSFGSTIRKNDGLVCVYGVTVRPEAQGDTPDQKKNLVIALVSPIFRATPCITRTGGLASASTTEESWLYYLNDQNYLMEFEIDNPNGPIQVMDNPINISPSTYITAFCDRGSSRHIIYQLPSGDLQSFDQDEGSTKPVRSRGDVLTNSPLAVIMLVTGKVGEEIGTAYLYLASTEGKLRRVESTTNGVWGNMKTFDHVNLGTNTQITIVHKKGSGNIVYYHQGKVLKSYTDVVPA